MNVLAKFTALPLFAKVCASLAAALLVSGWVNLHLYGRLAAADAECEARVLRSALDARAAAEDEREREQAVIASAAAEERQRATEKLDAAARRATAAANRLEGLIREHPPLPANAPAGDCFLPADWVRAADAAVPSG